jgi:ribosomal protein S17
LGVKVGDKVVFVDSRPYSKLKRWKILEIVKKDKETKAKKKGKTK